MMLIDSHCHLESQRFDADRDEIVARAVRAGVTRMITVGTNLEDAEAVLAIADAHREVFFALGIHPHDAKTANEAAYARMKQIAAHPKAVAWGEIGLDYHYDNSPRPVQREEFARQIHIARSLGLPLVIHTREADADTLEILTREADSPYRGVVHCFGGDVEFARRCLDLGFILSFTGVITYKKEMEAHRVIAFAGADRVMVETDCPFLTPAPHRGERNEPALVRLVAERMARVLGLDEAAVAEKTCANAMRLFTKMAAWIPTAEQ